MVLVETSIWIEFFQHPDSLYTIKLENLIKDHNRAALCGIILQETLQGIKKGSSYEITKERLCKLPFINTERKTYLYASYLYRTLRSKGITVPSVDVTIASLAVLHKIPLFTKDSHFKIIRVGIFLVEL